MALEGTLETVGLADLLRFLAASDRTGCLRVEGDGGPGKVWMRDGVVSAANADRVPGAAPDEALCDLLRSRTGSFVFDTGGRPPRVELAEPVEPLLSRAQLLLDEWRHLEVVVPSLEHRVSLVETIGHDQRVTVSAAQWSALVAVGGGCTVRRLAAVLGVGELQALRVVADLVTSGLAELQAPPTSTRRTRRPATTPR